MSEVQHERLERATESTVARAFTRFGMPALLALITWLGGTVLTDIRAAVNLLEDRSLSQGTQIQQVSSDVQLLNSKIDNGLLWRIGELERRLDAMERTEGVR